MDNLAISDASMPPVMTTDEARALTDQIKATADQLWRLLLEAHERQAWRALGYPSWREYAKTEFGMGQSHAYRLLDQGRVIRALETAANSPVGEISEREARDIKPHLVDVTTRIRERISEGQDSLGAVQDAVQAARDPNYLGARRRGDRSNRIVATLTLDAINVMEGADLVDFEALDASCVAGWVADLRQAAREIARFANRLEAKAGRANVA